MNGKNIINNEAIQITACARLHLTLIAMHNGGYRKNGGFGLAINDPSLTILSQRSKVFSIEDMREHHMSSDEISRLIEVITEVICIYSFDHNLNIKVTGNIKSHHGFGAGTLIRLSVLESLFILNNCAYTHDDIIRLSGRGGTSGIGIYTYFLGGAIIDIGHNKNITTLLPSSKTENRSSPAMLLNRLEMPDWEFGIFIPNGILTRAENYEQIFFETTCPVDDKFVYETLYHVIYGLCASVIDKDIDTFSMAVNAIQSNVWKCAERAEYGDDLIRYEKAIYESGASAVGMSSMGPALFFISSDIHNTIENIRTYKFDCDLFVAKSCNHGRHISYV